MHSARPVVVRFVTYLSCLSLVACTSLAPYPGQVSDLRQAGLNPSSTATIHLRSGPDKIVKVTSVEADRLVGTDLASKEEVSIAGKDIQSIEVPDSTKTLLAVGGVLLAIVGLSAIWAHRAVNAMFSK